MSESITKYTFATPYIDGDSEEAKVATVELLINTERKSFVINPGDGRITFTFMMNRSQKCHNMWLAVIESMKKATEFAIDILGYNAVKTESDNMVTTDSVGTIAIPSEILLNSYMPKIDIRSFNLIVQTIARHHYRSKPGDSLYGITYSRIRNQGVLEDLFNTPKRVFNDTPGLGRNTLKHIKNIFEEHGKTFK